MTVHYEATMSTVRMLNGRPFSAQDVRFAGRGSYDIAAKKVQSLRMVGSGTIRWLQEKTEPVDFDALIEWGASRNPE